MKITFATMRYFVELAYNGEAYHGWQVQPNAITVQQVLTETLSTYLRQEIQVTGCGRTDTGVHASQFFAHFDLSGELDTDKASFSVNNMLPADIAIYRIFAVAKDVHSRFDATSRTYQYFVHFNKDPFIRRTSYRYFKQLDVAAMNEACKMLFEYDDFTSFSKLHTDAKTNLCKIIEAEWKPFGNGLVFTIKANRFLRNMVRAVVGTMLEVGTGKITVDQVREIIEKKDRGEAGTSVPAHALFLYKVEYPEGII